jgi:hypothetical protein
MKGSIQKKGKTYYAAIPFAGELWGLQWGDVDWNPA